MIQKVDALGAHEGISRLAARLQSTWPRHGRGHVVLPHGYFANVIQIDMYEGIAFTTDGVGTKTQIATRMGQYDTIGIDCVAMNVNDLLCVGATPLSMVDYLAMGTIDPLVIDQIGIGLCKGALEAGISIAGGETAHLSNVDGFDLAGSAIGVVNLEDILDGRNIKPGDLVIGVRSSGIHSNGLTLAREALSYPKGFDPDAQFHELEVPIGLELLKPTDIYVNESLAIAEEMPVKAMVNITGDGLLNLSRVAAPVGFVIDAPIEPHPIFHLIQKLGHIPMNEMYQEFNMGVGFCYVIPSGFEPGILEILKAHGRAAQRIGYAIDDPQKRIQIPSHHLIGQDQKFHYTP